MDGFEPADAVGHRVVHGGSRYTEPVLIDDEVEEAIDELSRIAPLHNTPALRAIREARAALPGRAARRGLRHGVPRDDSRRGVDVRDPAALARLGRAPLRVPRDRGAVGRRRSSTPTRIVACHLGGGCSVTAVLDGRSVDTTMGFTPLEGVPMATRSGSVDPGALVYLLREHGLSVDELDARSRARVGARSARRARRPARLRRLHVPDRGRGGRRWRWRSAASTSLAFSGGVGENRADVRGLRSPSACCSSATSPSRSSRAGGARHRARGPRPAPPRAFACAGSPRRARERAT